VQYTNYLRPGYHEQSTITLDEFECRVLNLGQTWPVKSVHLVVTELIVPVQLIVVFERVNIVEF
jgi:hypothetical protein